MRLSIVLAEVLMFSMVEIIKLMIINVCYLSGCVLLQAGTFGDVDKSIGNLLYQVSTRIKDRCHLPILVEYIATKKIGSEVQLSFALDYLKNFPSLPVDEATFSKECGVGVVVSPEEIEDIVSSVWCFCVLDIL